jgi:hypothetical protein
VGEASGVRVTVLVGVRVMVADGKTKEVNVGKGVDDGRNVISCVMVKTNSSVGWSIVGSCLKVAVAVGNTNTSGNSRGGKGLRDDCGLMKINANTTQKIMITSNARIVNKFRTVFFMNYSLSPENLGHRQFYYTLIKVDDKLNYITDQNKITITIL